MAVARGNTFSNSSWVVTQAAVRQPPTAADYRETKTLLHDMRIGATIPQDFPTLASLLAWRRQAIDRKLGAV